MKRVRYMQYAQYTYKQIEVALKLDTQAFEIERESKLANAK